jgi:hypothetical protein
MSDNGTIVACTSAGTGTLSLMLIWTYTRSPIAVTLLTLPAERPNTRTSEAGNRAMVLGNQADSLYSLPPPPPTMEQDDRTMPARATKAVTRRTLMWGTSPPAA